MSTGDIHSLSPAQEQLWFVDRLRSGAAIEYLLSATLKIRGALDRGALIAALACIADRHPVLRSRFREIDGAAVRTVVDDQKLPLSEVDLPADRLPELLRRDLRTPIDLCEEPPWRITLVRLEKDEWVLFIVAHHIAFDGMSWSVLARELEALYGAIAAGEPNPLAPLPRGAEFATQPTGADLAFWRDRLTGLEPLTLPTDRARPTAWVADGDWVDFTVPADLARRLRSVGGRARTTPFTVYLAAFQLLLGRYAGQNDIGVGVSVSSRTPDERDRIGMFLNTVVLRTALDDREAFGALLGRVAQTAMDAFAHRDVPFDRVVDELAPERDPSRNPVFQAGVAWYDARRASFRLPGLDVTLIPPRWASSAFDLSLHLAQHADGSVAGQLIYPTSLFDRARIERMSANFIRLLSDIADRPHATLSELAGVAEPELTMLRAWGTGPEEPAEKSVPELFAGRVRATPDAVAVVSDGGVLSYAELAARVGGLANALRAKGVSTETRVGVALDRSADLVVAVLAVLCAGGTVVPLPVDYPAERMAYVAADAGVTLVLGSGIPVSEWPASGPLPQLDIHGAQVAYIIYTSGSTGRPKGVAVTHDGIRNRVLWSARHQLHPADRVLHKTTIAFDAAMWELLAPVVTGAAIVVAPTDAHRDPAVMVAAIARHGATVLQLVPSVLRLVVGEPGLAACTSLRLVCSAGEPLPASLCATLTGIVDVRIDNTYGPTECAIDATRHRYDGGDTGHVPIGQPLSNTRVSVVDSSGRLVPIGVPGELCITGAGVARGYVGRPELTAERFTPDPECPGARRYHTGDTVRWRADGSLEFLGRTDDQLKLNGVRVEPAEVEAVLATHPAVATAAVLVRRTPAGDPVLAAYAVPRPDALPAETELLDHLAVHLPASMVPASITLLDTLPLGPTGKLDRAALPDPDQARPASEDHVAPAGPVEVAVAEVMAELLGVPRVGATDDFFALGGHSLLAIRLVLALRRRFGGELTIGELFQDRTVRKLAARIAALATGAAIQPAERAGVLPLSFAQQRLWFLDRLDPGSVEYLIPLAMRLRGPFEPEVFRRAVTEVSRRHEVLRTRYVDRDGEPAQVVDPAGPIAFELVDLAGRPDADATGRAIVDRASSRPFDLAVEHPLRVAVVRLRPDEHLVALTLHHIAFDAWSMDILFRTLDEAYRGAAGDPAAVQYPDFAVWQRDQDLGPQLDHWTERLAGLNPIELVADRPRAAERDPRGATLAVTIPPEVASAALALANRHGVTPFMLLLAAFQVLLARYTDRTDIAVGTPVAGRTRQETEDLIGLFTNTLVLRTDLGGDPTFVELLDRVRTTCVAAFANQDLPFEHLVDALRPERDLSRNPLFQIMFEMAHLEKLPTSVCGTSVEHLRAGTPVAKFDLTVSVQQRAEGLRCVFEYATALFDEATIARMADHYLRLVAAVIADPTARSGSYELSSTADLERLLLDWPDPAGHRLSELDPPERHDRTVADLFELRAAARPDAIAAVQGDRAVTYGELNARANWFARVLLAHGARPETVVACCLERDLDAIVVLLAVLKAGAVYAPFDPRHPAERLAFMLADAGATIVVTAPEFTDQFAGHVVLTVDGGLDPANLGMPVPRNQLAYVIYTSGSTGRPKGVMIEHRSYAHHCQVIADSYDIGPDDRVVLLSALTFDVAMDQIGATLLAGATIVVADPALWTPPDLPARIAEHGVTIMEITPAYYRECLRYGPNLLSGLRLMNVGGDVVTVADARAWAATGLPGRFLCNYGPTEATVTCMLFPVGRAELDGARDAASMPIGRAVPGTRVYVLDADLRPVPVGVPGELCLGGTRLARGYLGRPELTARAFVPDPFGGKGSRLYRTGDLVRYRPDGAIEFLGRIDHQVKIRGLRIELGEIEAALLRHPAVEAAVVVAAGERLAAYVVGPAADPRELRAGLRDMLPEYMVPSFWTTLPALPMTASGKINRAALPAPAPVTAETAVGPRTPAEQTVAGIWCEVLDRESVGVEDDFFALGGHSLLATRVRAQLRTAFGVDLPLRRLFEATTVAAVTEAVTQALEDDIAALTDAEVAALLATDSRT